MKIARPNKTSNLSLSKVKSSTILENKSLLILTNHLTLRGEFLLHYLMQKINIINLLVLIAKIMEYQNYFYLNHHHVILIFHSRVFIARSMKKQRKLLEPATLVVCLITKYCLSAKKLLNQMILIVYLMNQLLSLRYH